MGWIVSHWLIREIWRNSNRACQQVLKKIRNFNFFNFEIPQISSFSGHWQQYQNLNFKFKGKFSANKVK